MNENNLTAYGVHRRMPPMRKDRIWESKEVYFGKRPHSSKIIKMIEDRAKQAGQKFSAFVLTMLAEGAPKEVIEAIKQSRK